LTEAWRKAGGRIPDKALVLATIRRRAIDLGRSLDRRTRREQAVIEDRPDWFAPDFTEGDTRDHLVAAVQALPEALREVLILKNWGDLTFPAIARMTGVPVATATSRYRYALERLRGTLTEVRP
jgi:RNA polymerase sigma-70 factor (ECF subfamily)